MDHRQICIPHSCASWADVDRLAHSPSLRHSSGSMVPAEHDGWSAIASAWADVDRLAHSRSLRHGLGSMVPAEHDMGGVPSRALNFIWQEPGRCSRNSQADCLLPMPQSRALTDGPRHDPLFFLERNGSRRTGRREHPRIACRVASTRYAGDNCRGSCRYPAKKKGSRLKK